MICRGLPAHWVNGWLAAVGATVLDDRLRLHWTSEGEPLAVLSAEGADPVEVLVESWPDVQVLDDLPIAENWRGIGKMQRKVDVDTFRKRAAKARGHPYSWALSSTMTDLCVDEKGEVKHAPFDASGPGTIKWLHHRLAKIHSHVLQSEVRVSVARIKGSLMGHADRVQDNGLGFDQSRLSSSADKTKKWTHPVVEELAFFGMAILPVRGPGIDRRLDRRARVREIQRGWRKPKKKTSTSRGGYSFYWPAWGQPLDHAGIDALLDAWNPTKKSEWSLLEIHAGWKTVPWLQKGISDRTTAFGSERL